MKLSWFRQVADGTASSSRPRWIRKGRAWEATKGPAASSQTKMARHWASRSSNPSSLTRAWSSPDSGAGSTGRSLGERKGLKGSMTRRGGFGRTGQDDLPEGARQFEQGGRASVVQLGKDVVQQEDRLVPRR